MDDDSDRSSEATQLEQNSTAEDTHHLHDDDEAEDSPTGNEYDEQRAVSPLQASPMSPEEDSRTSQSVTLAASDLSEVPVKYEMRRDELEHLKNQLQGSHQEALATVIAQAAQLHSNNHISSLQCSNSQEPEANQEDTTTDPKPLSFSHTVKIPIDSYNWRKYGQKQVKSPEGSRSYYKCTYAECDAKKIKSCDQFNSVTKIVYKGHHEHDPPKNVFSKGGKSLSSPKSLKRKSLSTSGLEEGGSIQVEQMDRPQRKQRVKKSSLISPGSVLKPSKKPKFIVHAAVDVEISADGYRWRKYGQKMVKGNPHPRNYYKCTCAGCPVRKHIEKAVDGTSEVIITYKGVHDHDMPVPKKRQGPPSGLLITAASSASKNILQSKRNEHLLSNHVSSNTEAVKTNESARTLLSVGFEIKRC